MTLAIKQNGAWVEVPFGQPVVVDDLSASYATVSSWSEDDRNAFGVWTVPVPDAPPAGQVEASRALVGADAPVWSVTYRPAAPAVPLSVHAYQFAGQAAYEGIITEAEGKAWAGAGTIPVSLQAAVDKLVTDVEAHDRVTFFLVGATEFPRYHPNTIALAPAFGKGTPEELDAFFIAAGER